MTTTTRVVSSLQLVDLFATAPAFVVGSTGTLFASLNAKPASPVEFSVKF